MLNPRPCGGRLATLSASVLIALLMAPAIDAGEADRDVVAGELGRKLDAHMTALADDGFSGALLVAKDGQVAIAKGYGYADRQRQIPFTSATVFDIGSITKQFTGAAIAKLEMQGKLSSEDKLSKYYENVPADKSGITLYQLLTHSAGVKDAFGDDYQVATRRWIEQQVFESELLYPPGKRHRYSNAGYSILAAIVEQVSGQPYETYLREQLFLPAGMRHTGYRLPDWSDVTMAHGYREGKDDGTPLDHRWADDGPYWNLRGNGGILSTVWDLHRWHQALLDDEILSAEARKRMFARRVQEGFVVKSWYGYGWSLRDTKRGTRVVEHTGGNGIFFADFARFIDDDVVIIAASNRSEDRNGAYVRGIADVVFP